MDSVIRKLHGIEVAGIPVGLAIGFVIGLSVVKIVNSLVSKVPAIGNIIAKAPIAVGGGLAFVFQLSPVKKFIGAEGANVLSVASVFMGIEEQIRTMKGQSLSDLIASMVNKVGKATTPATTALTAGATQMPFAGVTARPVVGSVGYPATAEIGLNRISSTSDIASTLRSYIQNKGLRKTKIKL